MSEQTKIASAFVKAQGQFGKALKTAKNPFFKTSYADLSSCVDAVLDALNKNGIGVVQRCFKCDDGVLVETVFIHESGETIECGQLHVPASKPDAQSYGSALTYARRYSLMAACMLAPEDDDGHAATVAGKVAHRDDAEAHNRIVKATAAIIREQIANSDSDGLRKTMFNMDETIKGDVWRSLTPVEQVACKAAKEAE